MEEIAWKKDKTPYIVFPCNKCNQFSYVKTSRKAKKCVRCGRINNISTIVEKGEIVHGISTAVELVKQKQDEFALQTFGTRPDFRTYNDFKILKSSTTKKVEVKEKADNTEYVEKFKEMLIKLSMMHKNFPYYLIEIMADNYNIPSSEVKLLTRHFQKRGILIRQYDGLYKINFEEVD